MKNTFSKIRAMFEEFPETWFFVFANLVFILMYVWSVMTTPSLSNPGPFTLFTTLMIIHLGFHWSLMAIGESEKWFWPYILVQGLLAFVITYLSQNIGMILGLYMGLIGEAIGIGNHRRKRIVAVLFFLLLLMVNYIILVGADYSLWWIAGIIPILIFVVLYVSLFTREAKGREQAQKLLNELEVVNRQLSEYAAQVEDLTLANERQRMARELHDTLAQGLAGLILQLEAADSHIAADRPQKAQSIILQAMQRARTTLADARKAIGDLRESPASTADLTKSVQGEVDRFTHITGIPCRIELCKPDQLPLQTAENALRAVSEGLMNIAKHAQATEAEVKMTCSRENLSIEIIDNGIGFNPSDSLGRSGHYGLLGLRERARIFGGSLSIESQPSQGTSLKIQMPLRETNE